MPLIKLHQGDIQEVRKVSIPLALYWAKKSQNDYQNILGGLYSEFAAIKYLNSHCGAIPKIKFNTEYKNGIDGGFDFEFLPNCKWDVKSTKANSIQTQFANKTNADLIIGVRRYSTELHEIWGFIPKNKIPLGGELHAHDFRDVQVLKKGFPEYFNTPTDVMEDNYNAEPEKAANSIQAVLGMINLKSGGAHI